MSQVFAQAFGYSNATQANLNAPSDMRAAANAMDGKGFAVDDIGATNAGTVGDMAGAALGPVAGALTGQLTKSAASGAVMRETASVVVGKKVKSEMEHKK